MGQWQYHDDDCGDAYAHHGDASGSVYGHGTVHDANQIFHDNDREGNDAF